MNRPICKVEQGIFRDCYPPPLPFMNEYEDVKMKVEDDGELSLNKTIWRE